MSTGLEKNNRLLKLVNNFFGDEDMNARDRWNRIMKYEKVDRLPVLAIEWYFEDITIQNWRLQGLPKNKTPEEFLEMDRVVDIPINFMPIPAFEHKILFEDENTIIETDDMGTTVKRDKKAPKMFYGHIAHPVKDFSDWNDYKKHFDAKKEGRYFADMIESGISATLAQKSTIDNINYQDTELEYKLKQLDESENPIGLNFLPFFMRLGFYTMGMERFLMAFYDYPELIHDMFSFWSEFILELISPVLGKVKIDYVTITEDLAYKNGPHFSPQIYKEFWLPYQNNIISQLKKNGIELINIWTSGNIDALLPIMMSNGINCTWPVDRNSDMDPVRLRKEYGKELRMVGGIPKQTLFDGKDAIDREIDRLMPLIEEGGFIPALDDVVPPETPLNHYIYLIEKIKSIKL